jgi:hypothetical protein
MFHGDPLTSADFHDSGRKTHKPGGHKRTADPSNSQSHHQNRQLDFKLSPTRQHPAKKRESLACLFVGTNERLIHVTANRTTKIAS